jgi:hypothetical protein
VLGVGVSRHAGNRRTSYAVWTQSHGIKRPLHCVVTCRLRLRHLMSQMTAMVMTAQMACAGFSTSHQHPPAPIVVQQ